MNLHDLLTPYVGQKANELEILICHHFNLSRKRKRVRSVRLYRGEKITPKGKHWIWRNASYDSLKSVKFQIAVSQAKSGKGKVEIKRPGLAPFFVVIQGGSVQVKRQYDGYEKNESWPSSIEGAAAYISQRLIVFGKKLSADEVLETLNKG